ncbi:unnamed protein product [Pleuronectes platessa]|uniref:Uncharacterized protein n=1 Tax=Pleuronectes platessa TaxID=8262 RepID=A0A9N7YP53_PLEPL|nr:unnamed protein product [Pleuronectes platessa]
MPSDGYWAAVSTSNGLNLGRGSSRVLTDSHSDPPAQRRRSTVLSLSVCGAALTLYSMKKRAVLLHGPPGVVSDGEAVPVVLFLLFPSSFSPRQVHGTTQVETSHPPHRSGFLKGSPGVPWLFEKIDPSRVITATDKFLTGTRAIIQKLIICQIVLCYAGLPACFPRTDHLLSIPDLPASSLPWILPQPSVFDHEFRLFPPGYAPARFCGYTAHHWTCLPAR